MKKNFVIMILVLMVIFSFGCSANARISKEIDDYIAEYISSNELEQISSVDNEVEKVIAYSNDNKFGLVYFKYDDEAEKVISENIISNGDSLEKVSYSQIEGIKENYVGLIISQNTTLTDSSNIKVTFSESLNGESNSIIQTIYGKRALVMSYNNENGLNEIEKIELLHQDGEELSN